jgi:hypothetical protein
MADSFADQLSEIRASGSVSDAQVLAMRQAFYADGGIGGDEAEAMVLVDEAVGEASAAWTGFYLDALTDFIVLQQQPEGFVDQAKADWLTSHVLRDGRLGRTTELELLVHVLEAAKSVPASFQAFVLDQVRAATVDRATAGAMTDEDVARLRRLVFAYGGAGDISVTHGEAEALFDINDALHGRPQPASWRDLFVKAVASAVMAAHTVTPETRAEEVELERPPLNGLAAFAANVSKALRDFRPGLPHALEPSVDPYDLYAERNAADAVARTEAQTLSGEEARWLVGLITRDGVLDDNEAALVAYLREQSPQAGQALMAAGGA